MVSTELGGMPAAIESGWIQSQIQDAAYAYQRAIETKERIVVGVNEYRMDDEHAVPLHRLDSTIEASQVIRLNSIRGSRDKKMLAESLDCLDKAARSDENLMPHIVNAVERYASVGEISDVFRRVHGEYREALAL